MSHIGIQHAPALSKTYRQSSCSSPHTHSYTRGHIGVIQYKTWDTLTVCTFTVAYSLQNVLQSAEGSCSQGNGIYVTTCAYRLDESIDSSFYDVQSVDWLVYYVKNA